MPPFGPISRRELIRTLRDVGFEGPYPKRRHEAMLRGQVSVIIPNPHRGDVDRNLLARVLRQAGISREEWERL